MLWVMRALVVLLVLGLLALGLVMERTEAAGDPVIGDVQCDRLVDAEDALLILQHEAALGVYLPCSPYGDVNNDGRLNVLDALLILQYDVGLLDVFPLYYCEEACPVA